MIKPGFRIVFTVFLTAILPVITSALEFDQPLPDSLTEQFQHTLDNYTQDSIPGYSHGYSAAVHIEGIGMWIGVTGNAVRGKRTATDNGTEYLGAIPLQPGDQFHIGSLTKQFVSVVVLRLMEEGKLTLDDTLEQWVPGGVVANAELITIRQLLSHTSGVYDNTALPEFFSTVTIDPNSSGTAKEVIEFVKDKTPKFSPGQEGKFSYSNSGYTLLHMIVEAVTGKPFVEEFHRLVTQPLSLNETYYGGFEEMPDYPTLGYEGSGVVSKNMHLSWAAGAGNIVSTADNVCRFASTVFGGYYLQPESLIDMITPIESDYGLGVWIINGNGKYILHSGSIFGFRSEMIYNANHGITVVCLQNSSSTNNTRKINSEFLNISYDWIETVVYEWSLY